MASTKPSIDTGKWLTLLCVLLAFAACVAYAPVTRHVKTRWPGVPPAPSYTTSMMYGFGDKQLAYYALVLTLQNMGDIGGHTTAIKDYDMNNVSEWLRLTYQFDKDSRYAPTLAGYYFGASQDPSKLRPIISYLRVVGNRPDRDLWRYLAQGVYLARFRLKDQQLALDLAYQLAALQGPDLPIWTKQMPAFVMSRMGQKEASRDLFLTIMATSKNISRQELNFMCGYIQDNLREPH
ncbi:MAG TPA: hypothetical protein VGF14_07145, partial [Alphaproteobacteria bacterium]